MIRVDELSWCFFHVFLWFRIRVYVQVFCAKFVSDFLRDFSCSRIFFLVYICFFMSGSYLLLVWSVMIWILCLFNAFSDFYWTSFHVVRKSCDDIGLEQKLNRRSIINDGMSDFGIMTTLIVRCVVVGVMYFVCWRIFAFVNVRFLLFVVCHFRDVSVKITSFCLWFCVSLRVDVS